MFVATEFTPEQVHLRAPMAMEKCMLQEVHLATSMSVDKAMPECLWDCGTVANGYAQAGSKGKERSSSQY